MVNLTPGQTITLTPWQGKEYNGQEFPPGLYCIHCYGAKGGTGQHGIPGGNGGHAMGYLRTYEEKIFSFNIGTMGALYYPGRCVSPGMADQNVQYSSYGCGGFGGYDNPTYGAREHGGGGGGMTAFSISHKYYNYSRGNVVMNAGGGGGGNGWSAWNQWAYGEPGGYEYDVDESVSPTNQTSSRINDRGQNGIANSSVSEGGGGGGGGNPGGGIKPISTQFTGGWGCGGGGYGGRNRNKVNYSMPNCDYYNVHNYVGTNSGHGYITVQYIDYIWYSIYWTNCIYTITRGKEGDRITGNANITYNTIGPDGKIYRCNENLGFFSHIAYSYVSDVKFNDDKTEITFTMQRNAAYINAVFINYKIICTRCVAINNGDKVLIPGRKYRVKAEPESNGHPFIDFIMSGIDRDSVRWISRLEFEFTMPEANVYVTALYEDDTRYNTDIYKQIGIVTYFDWDRL